MEDSLEVEVGGIGEECTWKYMEGADICKEADSKFICCVVVDDGPA